MKIQFEQINELLDSTKDVAHAFDRVELPHSYQFELKNPHLPVDRKNLVDSSRWDLI